MIKVDSMLRSSGLDAKLILQIHDELLIEAADRGAGENEKLMRSVQEAMEGVMQLSVPLKVDAGSGKTWTEAQA
jgi:DNA polymerase-1